MTALTFPRSLPTVRLSTPGLVSILFLAGIILRLTLLGAAPLWYDESGSRWMAQLPWDKMIAATAGDAHPPLYLALLWSWIRVFGDGASAVRMPSVIASALCVPITFAIARRLNLSKPVSLVASALVAVLPAQLWYAQEARMYALLTLEVAVALYAALGRNWIVFGLALAAGYWTHNYGLFYAVPLNIVGMWSVRREAKGESMLPELAWMFVTNVFAIASWFPWLTVLIGQMRAVSAGYWIQAVTPGQVLYVLYMAVMAFAPTEALQVHAALFVFIVAAFVVARALAHRQPGVLLMIAFCAVLIGVSVIVSLAWKPIILFRAFVPLGIPICICVGWAVTESLSVSRRLAVGLLAGPLLAAALVSGFARAPEVKNDSALLAYIQPQPGDIVYHVNDGSLMIAHTYLPDLPQFEMPAAWLTPGALSDKTKAAMGVQVAALESLKWRRAWLIVGATPMTTAQEDEAVRQLLLHYVSERIYFKGDELSTQAIYLLLNHKIVGGVP